MNKDLLWPHDVDQLTETQIQEMWARREAEDGPGLIEQMWADNVNAWAS